MSATRLLQDAFCSLAATASSGLPGYLGAGFTLLQVAVVQGFMSTELAQYDTRLPFGMPGWSTQ